MDRLRIALHVGAAILALLFALPRPAIAHGGGIDAYGGHNDTKKGNYHSHQGNCKGKTFASKAAAIKAGCKR